MCHFVPKFLLHFFLSDFILKTINQWHFKSNFFFGMQQMGSIFLLKSIWNIQSDTCVLCLFSVFWTRLCVKSRPALRPPLPPCWSPAAVTPIFLLWDSQTSPTSSMSPTRCEAHKSDNEMNCLTCVFVFYSKRFLYFNCVHMQSSSLCLRQSFCWVFFCVCVRNSETWQWSRLRGSAVDTESGCCRLTKTSPKKMQWADKQFIRDIIQSDLKTTKQPPTPSSCVFVQLRLVTPDVSIPHETLSDVYDLFKVSPYPFSTKQPVVSSVDAFFSSLLQTEHLISLYWGDSSSAAAAEVAAWDHGGSSRSYLERQYRLDRPQFKSLFGLLVPWPGGSNQHGDTLANRTFTLLDQDRNNLVTFREFACWLGR